MRERKEGGGQRGEGEEDEADRTAWLSPKNALVSLYPFCEPNGADLALTALSNWSLGSEGNGTWAISGSKEDYILC